MCVIEDSCWCFSLYHCSCIVEIVYSKCDEFDSLFFFHLAASVATGLLGMMGNKGGVGIRMEINNSPVVFVCSHLAAHREKVAERNADYHR